MRKRLGAVAVVRALLVVLADVVVGGMLAHVLAVLVLVVVGRVDLRVVADIIALVHVRR